jgi:hypothetical protein
MLRCEVCAASFPRAKTGNPARYCSKACRNKGYYEEHRGDRKRRPKRTLTEKKALKSLYDRIYHPIYYQRNRERKLAYGRRYNLLPHVRERQRARYYALYRDPYIDIEIPTPYTGHRWLEMARGLIAPHHDPTGPTAEWLHDEMGEVLLAIMEGRDPKDALRQFRNREFVSRFLTVSMSDWKTGKDDESRWFDQVMPTVESAEEEAMIRFEIKARYHRGSNKPFRDGKQRQQQPSRRRMKDAGWRR